jgi:mono/diheme cytochrome c family protein
MKHVNVGLTMAFLALLLLSLVVACSTAQVETLAPDAGTLDGKALTEERCSVCHDLGRVTAARKAQEEWQATVERMVANGAKLNQAEQDAVIQYLAETYPK